MSTEGQRQHVADMIARARSRIENLSPAAAAREIETSDVVLVDLREGAERDAVSAITGSVHIPRGMLEFHADPASPYHRDELDPRARLILYCASGGRSALAAETLGYMGYHNVAHVDGGLRAWNEQVQHAPPTPSAIADRPEHHPSRLRDLT